MTPGQVFTIEPMVNEGSPGFMEWADGWTVTTVDGLRSAQFEHTFLVTDHGLEALTEQRCQSQPPWWEEEPEDEGSVEQARRPA